MKITQPILATVRRWIGAIPLPRPTVRLRLTLIYGGLFLASGAVLLTVTYALVAHATSPTVFAANQGGGGALVSIDASGLKAVIAPVPAQQAGGTLSLSGGTFAGKPSPQQLGALAQQLNTIATQQHNDQLNQLLVQSAIALGGMAVLSIVLGWLIAGRVLHPLRTMTEAAQSISATNLHRRLALGGPDDELKELGDTFDGLLGRLEQSFDAQRQFIANASHELRTPLARQRTLVEVALRDPAPTVDTLRAACDRVLVAGEHQERIIEALLVLARSERGLDRREPVDLAAITQEVLLGRGPEVEQRGLQLETSVEAAQLSGAPDLVERLVTNLVDNAVQHNVAGGQVTVVARSSAGGAVLRVANSGPVVPAADLDRLFQPFQRSGADRAAAPDGVGLGLSIAKAVVIAHGATITALAPATGGLEVEVVFPAS